MAFEILTVEQASFSSAPPAYELTEEENARVRRAQGWGDRHRKDAEASFASLIAASEKERLARDAASSAVLPAMEERMRQEAQRTSGELKRDDLGESERMRLEKDKEGLERGLKAMSVLHDSTREAEEARRASWRRLDDETRQAFDLLEACRRLTREGVPDANEPTRRLEWAWQVLSLADCRKDAGRQTFWAWLLREGATVRAFLALVPVALDIVEPEELSGLKPASGQGLPWPDVALALLFGKGQRWTVDRLAREVGKHRTTLRRHPKVKAALDARGSGRALPRGYREARTGALDEEYEDPALLELLGEVERID